MTAIDPAWLHATRSALRQTLTRLEFADRESESPHATEALMRMRTTIAAWEVFMVEQGVTP